MYGDDYPERATSGDDLAEQIDSAYREIHREQVSRYLSERDVRRGYREESVEKAWIVSVAFLVAALIVLAYLIRAVLR